MAQRCGVSPEHDSAVDPSTDEEKRTRTERDWDGELPVERAQGEHRPRGERLGRGVEALGAARIGQVDGLGRVAPHHQRAAVGKADRHVPFSRHGGVGEAPDPVGPDRVGRSGSRIRDVPQAAASRRARRPSQRIRSWLRGSAEFIGFFVEESARDTGCSRVAAEWFVRMRPPGASPPVGSRLLWCRRHKVGNHSERETKARARAALRPGRSVASSAS